MTFVRALWTFGFAAGLTACSGNLGGGQSTLPGTLPQQGGTNNVQGVAAPAPTASPVSASNVATIGDSVTAQPLPAVMGWSGSIAFPKPVPAPSPSPNAKATAAAAVPAGPVSIGITAAVVEPTDAPHFSSADGKGHSSGKGAASKGLFFISLLSTADVTLGEYPKIAIDVPREIATKYRDHPFALALYDPETKEKTYRLAVAELDPATPAPGSVPTATPTPIPTAVPNAPANGPLEFTPPPVTSLSDSNLLPPEHIAFLATAATLSLKSNRPVVFAVYAAPIEPSPSPSPSAASVLSSPAASNAGSAGSRSTLPTPAASTSPVPSPAASAT